MGKVAFIFPGQGAQCVGMGKDFYEGFAVAREVIDQADEILGNGLKQVMFGGLEERLTETAFCQPALLAVSIAAMRVIQEQNPSLEPSFVAGLSLGEYSALAASGALDFSATVRLVERRGALMNEAAALRKGGMAAVIGLEADQVAEACRQAGAEVANFNAPDQTVITGEADKVAAASAILTGLGAKRVIPLAVSGAFHSSLMVPAADRFRPILDGTMFGDARVPIVSNVDAAPVSEAGRIRENLARQIVSSVQWVKTIEFMKAQGVVEYIEIGPGKVLKGLLRRIDRDLAVKTIERVEDLSSL